MDSPVLNENTISRRDFVRTAALVTSGLALGSQLLAQNQAAPVKPMIGFQAEESYLRSYGVERFLDDIQNRAAVNTLMLRTVLFEPSNPGNEFATAHPQYYGNVLMKPQPLGASDHNLPESMRKITAETKKRGMRIVCWMQEDNRTKPNIKGMDQLYEIDLHGGRTQGHPGGPCLNNPYFRNLIAAQIEDYIREYEIDGLQRGSERQGPLGNALGAWHHGSRSDPGKTSCFCEHCQAKAAKLGIDFEKVKKAYQALETYVRDGREGKRPRDGYYVEFWRILLRHPELLVWETFWTDSQREMHREFSAKAKSLRPGIEIGYHIWHNASFNPIYRAEQDYRVYTEFADYIKPVVYDNPAGERMASFVESMSQNIFGDLSPQQILDFQYSVMGYREKPFDQIIGMPRPDYQAQLRQLEINGTPRGTFERFSADYVYKETKRAMDAMAGTKTRVCAGLGIDVVVQNSTPQSVREAVEAVFRAGGTGIVISTSHAAMKPENLSAVGATLRELKLV